MGDDGTSKKRHERLRSGEGQRVEPVAIAGGQDERLHLPYVRVEGEAQKGRPLRPCIPLTAAMSPAWPAQCMLTNWSTKLSGCWPKNCESTLRSKSASLRVATYSSASCCTFWPYSLMTDMGTW